MFVVATGQHVSRLCYWTAEFLACCLSEFLCCHFQHPDELSSSDFMNPCYVASLLQLPPLVIMRSLVLALAFFCLLCCSAARPERRRPKLVTVKRRNDTTIQNNTPGERLGVNETICTAKKREKNRNKNFWSSF